MLDATPDDDARRRATIETSPGRGFASSDEELIDGRAAAEEKRAEPWPL